jgi:hypothetical protein
MITYRYGVRKSLTKTNCATKPLAQRASSTSIKDRFDFVRPFAGDSIRSAMEQGVLLRVRHTEEDSVLPKAGPFSRRGNMQVPRLRTAALTAALMTAAVPALPSSAHAWGHGGWGWGGFGVGLAAGALIGGALAAPYYGGYYGYGYPAYAYGYDYPDYGYGYSGYGYAPAYYGSYGYARPYYAYGGRYYRRHWVHRRHHHYAY